MSLLNGLNHVAVLTSDLSRFVGFYTRIFELEVVFDETTPAMRHAILRTGAQSWLHPVEIRGEAQAATPARLLERGRLDHLALTAASAESFDVIRGRLLECGATDGGVDDLGAFRTLWFEDPDGMLGEVTLITDPALGLIHEPRRISEQS